MDWENSELLLTAAIGIPEYSVFSIPGSQDPYPSAGTCQGFLLLKTGGIRTPRPTTEFRGSGEYL